MLTAEKYFAVAMQTLWPGEGAPVVTVAFPDPDWVKDAVGDAVSVFVDDDQAITGASDRSVSRSVPGPQSSVSVFRGRGWVNLVLEVRIRALSETRLNELAGQFRDAFPMGFAFGPEGNTKQFQIIGNPSGSRVRPREDEARRCERIYRVPVRGPWEVLSEAWPVETMQTKVAP